MKYIQMSLMISLIAYVSYKNIVLAIFAMILYGYYLYKRNEHKELSITLIVVLFVILHVVLLLLPYGPKDEFTCYVSESRDGYYIVDEVFSTHKYIIYTDEVYGIFDVLNIKGTATEIHSLANFHLFNYETYMKRQGALYSYDNPRIKVVYTSQLGMLSRHLKQGNNEVLQYFLFKANEEENSYESIFLSTGMHFSMLFMLLYKIIGFFVYEEYDRRICSVVKGIFLLCFPTNFGLFRIVLLDLLRYYSKNRFKRILLFVSIIMILQPYRIYSLSFLLPCLFMLSNIFIETSYLNRILLTVPVQIQMSFKLPIIFIIFFQPLSFIYASIFGLALLGFSGLASNIYDFMHVVTSFMEANSVSVGIGYMPLVILVLYYAALLMYKNYKMQIVIVLSVFILNTCNLFTTLTMNDIGQGDSVLIEYPFKKGVVMVDTGGNPYKDLAEDVLIPVLDSKGIKAIDLLFLTHDDFDHSGASESLIASFKVRDVIREMNEKTIMIDGNHSIDVYQFADSEDTNSSSLITYFHFGDITYFSAGDIGKDEEEKIIRRHVIDEATILKLSHHGSNTSNSKKFLQYMHPSLILNSSGFHNFYGHPSTEVLKSVHDLSLTMYDTQNEGAIKLTFIGPFVVIESARSGLIGMIFT